MEYLANDENLKQFKIDNEKLMEDVFYCINNTRDHRV